MDEIRTENQREDLDLDLDITFDEGQDNTEAQPQQTQPQPQPQPQQYGPFSSLVAQKYQEAQRQYEELIQRKKQLRESGYDVPVELDAAIAREAAKLATLEAQLEEDRRRDAMAAVPVVVSRLVSELSPQVAKRVEPELRRAIEQAVAINPDVLKNEEQLRIVLHAIIGQLAAKQLTQRRAQPQATPPAGVPNPPPTNNPKPAPEVPEIAKRLGVSESAWRRVAELPDEGWTDIDL